MSFTCCLRHKSLKQLILHYGSHPAPPTPKLLLGMVGFPDSYYFSDSDCIKKPRYSNNNNANKTASTPLYTQVPGFCSRVAPGLIDLAWRSLQTHASSRKLRLTLTQKQASEQQQVQQQQVQQVHLQDRLHVQHHQLQGGNQQLLQQLQELQPEELEEFSLLGYKRALGVPALTGTAGGNAKDLLVARWCKPSLSVVDMRPGVSMSAGALGGSNCYR